QPGDYAVFFGDVPANGQPCALLAADGDLVLVDKLADELEAHGRFVQRNLEMVGERVDEVGGRDGLGHSVAPAARLHQIIEQQCDDVVWLDESAVAVHNA